MAFNDNIKALRTKAGLTQESLSASIGVTKRTIIKYEAGQTIPTMDVLVKFAKYFDVSIDSLVTEEEAFVTQVYEEKGIRDARYAESLVSEISGVFAGGRLSEDDKDAVMRAIQNAYWTAKEENKKFIPLKYRKDAEPD